MPSRKSAGRLIPAEVDPRFLRLVDRFAAERGVTRGQPRGFGAGALKVNGKIFVMLSSKGAFVVKLPRERVAALVGSGRAELFDPRGGRPMREWAVIKDEKADWLDLARQAYQYGKQSTD